LEQLSKLAARRKRSSVTRLTKNSKILKAIVHAIQEKKGEHVVSLDLRRIPEAVADFFIICEASSTVQVKAIADFVEDHLKKSLGEIPYHPRRDASGHWVPDRLRKCSGACNAIGNEEILQAEEM
jgi:ribosome-associated protein